MDEIIYLVAGATGVLGQKLVSKLLLRSQHVRALVRDADKGRALLGENLEVVEGDVRRIDTVHDVMMNVHTVICAAGARTAEGTNTPEQVDYEGVRNLVLAAQHAAVKRFLLVSSLAVTRPEHPLNRFGHVLDWKRRGEDALRDSGIAYTIVRPGGLTDEPGGQKGILLGQGDTISGRISRADLAEVCLRALDSDRTQNTTFEVVETDGLPPSDWDALFDALKPDAQAARA